MRSATSSTTASSGGPSLSDFPPWDRVYAFFRRWRDHGLVREFHDRLRRKVREHAGRDPEPSAGVIDSQSVKADAVVGADSRGFDGGNYLGSSVMLGRVDQGWWTAAKLVT